MRTHLLIRFTLLQASTCLACYVEIRSPDAGNVDWMVKPSTISNYYTPLINRGVDPSIQSVWYFEVKSCAETGILITRNSDLSGVLYEIIIGGNKNKRIFLHTSSSSYIEYTSPTGSFLSCSRFIRFWLRWTVEGVISLGSGDIQGQNTYFSTSVHSTAIGGIGVNSCYGTDADWRYGVISSNPVPDICPPNQATATTEEVATNTAAFTESSGITTATKSLSIITTTTTSDALDCTLTPSILRAQTTTGRFKRDMVIQLRALNQIGSSLQCSLSSCAQSCLSNTGCWYFRFDTSEIDCQPCLLYDSSMSACFERGPVDGLLYAWV